MDSVDPTTASTTTADKTNEPSSAPTTRTRQPDANQNETSGDTQDPPALLASPRLSVSTRARTTCNNATTTAGPKTTAGPSTRKRASRDDESGEDYEEESDDEPNEEPNYDSEYDPQEKPKKRKKKYGPYPRKKTKSIRDIRFEEMVELLKVYKAKHGDCLVSTTSKKTSPDYKLGMWVDQIRNQYRLLKKGKHSTLTMSRMVQLNEVGFCFNRRPEGFTTWDERLEQCRAHVAEHGHLRISQKHPVLGKFVSYVRGAYRLNCRGERSMLTPERHKQLSDLGFVFVGGPPVPKDKHLNAKPWAARLEEFVEFKTMHGHPYPPQSLKGGLGLWAARQRQEAKWFNNGEKSPMTAEKMLKLTQAGFPFDASFIRRTPKSSLLECANEVEDITTRAAAAAAAVAVPTATEDLERSSESS